MLTTSFRLLHEHDACADRYRYLAKALGGITEYGREKPIPLSKILETNGLDDCLWALRATNPSQDAERDIVARRFACRCVRETPIGDGSTVWDLLTTDERSKNAVLVAESFILGRATRDELDAAWAAAWAAESAAESAAARDAAWAVAIAAESAAESAVASAAAKAAAWAAAWAARAATWAVASAAAKAAESAAARAAAWAARAATWAVASAAAKAAASEYQTAILKGLLAEATDEEGET